MGIGFVHSTDMVELNQKVFWDWEVQMLNWWEGIEKILLARHLTSRGYVLQRSCEATISFKIIITVASKFNISQQNIMVQSLKAKNGLYWSFEPTSSLKILIKFALKFNIRSSVKISMRMVEILATELKSILEQLWQVSWGCYWPQRICRGHFLR